MRQQRHVQDRRQPTDDHQPVLASGSGIEWLVDILSVLTKQGGGVRYIPHAAGLRSLGGVWRPRHLDGRGVISCYWEETVSRASVMEAGRRRISAEQLNRMREKAPQPESEMGPNQHRLHRQHTPLHTKPRTLLEIRAARAAITAAIKDVNAADANAVVVDSNAADAREAESSYACGVTPPRARDAQSSGEAQQRAEPHQQEEEKEGTVATRARSSMSTPLMSPALAGRGSASDAELDPLTAVLHQATVYGLELPPPPSPQSYRAPSPEGPSPGRLERVRSERQSRTLSLPRRQISGVASE